jgi:hypothetical protein
MTAEEYISKDGTDGEVEKCNIYLFCIAHFVHLFRSSVANVA